MNYHTTDRYFSGCLKVFHHFEEAPTFCAIRLSLLLTLLLLEFHVTMVEYSTSHFVDARLLLTIEAQDINGILFSKEFSTKCNFTKCI